MRKSLLTLVALVSMLSIAPAIDSATAAEKTPDWRGKSLLRRPIAIERRGDVYFVANARSGSLSLVGGKELLGEVPLAGRISAMSAGPRGLLVCDANRHELLLVSTGTTATDIRVEHRVPVAKYPVSVAASERTAAVVSSWSRRLTLVDLDEPSAKPAFVDLPFIGGKVAATPAGFVVSAAGEGRLAVIDPNSRRIRGELETPGHNVGGLHYDTVRDELLVTQQVLRGDTSTTYENVFWGVVLKNVLQAVPLRQLRNAGAKASKAAAKGEKAVPDAPDLVFLGFPSDAAGDPATVVTTPGGGTVVGLAGVDAVHVRSGPNAPFEALAAERRPAGIAISKDGKHAYVCNTYADSITVLDLENVEQAGTISLGPSPEPSLVDRGESLFHDARLSLDGWYSCHSCHTHGHSSDVPVDNLGDDDFGDAKRTPSLLGTHGTAPWAWTGSSPSLEAQVRKSILKTMRGEAAREEDVKALVAFMARLEPAPSLAAARGDARPALAKRGRDVFVAQGCRECHAGEKATSDQIVDVGLRDRLGNKAFNPPSLLGVSQRSRFLHDGRAKSLKAVFTDHEHPNGSTIDEQDLEALLEYLRGL